MKRIALFVVPLVLALALLIAIAPGFIDWSQYKEQIRSAARDRAGYEMAIAGDIGFTVIPYPRLYVEGVSVSTSSSSKPFAELQRLDIHVEPLPLLSGAVEVSSLEVISPRLHVTQDRDGHFNWMTPQVEALIQGGQKSGGASVSVALNKVYIEDGQVSYQQTGQEPITVAIPSMSVRADTLQGPFKADGRVIVQGHEIDLSLRSGALTLTEGAEAVPLNANISLNEPAMQLAYAGVVSVGETPVLQGKIEGKLPSGLDQGPLAGKPVTFAGMLTASPEAANIKDMDMTLAGDQWSGEISATLKPVLDVTANLQAAKAVDLDALLPAQGGAGVAFSIEDPLALIPDPLVLPFDFDADVNISAPGVIWQKKLLEDATLTASKEGGAVKLDLSLKDIPGSGNLALGVSGSYGSRSGGVYSEPDLTITLQGRSQNLPYSIEALTGRDDWPMVKAWKTAVADLSLSLAPGRLSLAQSRISLDDMSAQISGSYVTASRLKDSNRPRLTIDANIDKADLGRIMSGGEVIDPLQEAQQQVGAKKAGPPWHEKVSALDLPFDVVFDLGLANGSYSGQTVEGLRAKGSLIGDKLTLEGVSATSFADTAFVVKGSIPDIKTLSAVDLDVNMDSRNIRSLADAVSLPLDGLPENLKALKLTAALEGSVKEALGVDAVVNALNGKARIQGQVSSALTNPEFGDMTVELNHPDLGALLSAFAPEASYKSLAGPVKLSTSLSRTGSMTQLNNLKGSLAGTDVSGTLAVDNANADKPSISGNIKLGRLRLAGANTGGAQDVRWSREAIDVSWMRSMALDLAVAAEHIHYKGWELAQPSLSLNLVDGVLSIPDLKAGVYDGTLAANVTVSAPPSNRQPMRIDGVANLTGVNMQPLVKTLAGGVLVRGSGTLNLEANLKTSGISPAALIFDLGGQGSVTGSDIVLEGLDLERFARALSAESKPGDTALGLWQGATKGGSTAFDTLDGAFTVTEGVTTFSKLDLDGPKALIASRGIVDLPKWRLAIAHTITLKQREDVPPFTVNIEGPIDNPAETFAQGVLQDYLNRKIQRKLQDVLTDKLGLPGADTQAQSEAPANDNQAAQPPSQPQEFKPEDAIRGVLQGILSR